MKRSGFFLRDLAIVLLSLTVLILLSIGIYSLFTGRTPLPETWRGPARRQEQTAFIIPVIEERLRDLLKEALLARVRTIENEDLNRALEEILARFLPNVADMSSESEIEVEVLIADSDTVNAMAFPGGLIVVYSGLIQRLSSAEELAAVLAHELGHVVNHDSIKQLARQLGLAAFLSILGGSEASAIIRRIIEEVLHIRFSRRVEERADRFALELLLASKIDPARFGEALENLKEDRGKLEGLLEYIDTHPAIDGRIRKAKKFSAQYEGEKLPFNVNWQAIKDSLGGS